MGDVDLKNIMCLEYERTAANNYVLRFETRLFQILKSKKPLPRPKNKVIIPVAVDGTLTVLWKETKLLVKELTNDEPRRRAAGYRRSARYGFYASLIPLVSNF